MAADDFCEACGSEDCKGECQECWKCHQIGCGCPPEAPGARLERLAAEQRQKLHEGMQKAVERRLLPEPPKEEMTLEEFEAKLAKRPKVEVRKKKDGTTYRARIR